jgi:hypothetical protein
MRLVIGGTLSALAVGAVAVTTGLTAGSTATAATPTTASTVRHVIPSTFKSWQAQEQSMKVCKPIRDDVQWEDCLLDHYQSVTGYNLMPVEYTTNGVKGTWKVSYSKITLPKGGTRLTSAQKRAKGLPTTVYFKVYKMAGGNMIIGSNGTSY